MMVSEVRAAKATSQHFMLAIIQMSRLTGVVAESMGQRIQESGLRPLLLPLRSCYQLDRRRVCRSKERQED